MRIAVAFALLASCLAAAARGDEKPAAEKNWPRWRGPLGTGVSPEGDPPVEFSETKNVRWKTALPGKGHSTPVVWGEHIFVTAAARVGDKLEKPFYSGRPGAHDNLPVTHRYDYFVLAVNRGTGKIRWRKSLNQLVPEEGAHYTASLASASAVTDGEHVLAHFGSAGLFCLDFDGDLVWKSELGQMQTKHGHGEGSGPALYGDTVLVNWDHEGDSFIVALDKRSGKQRWRKRRDEVTSWSTPLIIEHDGKPQAIVSGSNRVRGYDLATGEVLWECGGLAQNIVASPVYGNGMVFVGSSYEKRSLLAIRLAGAKGDITETENVAWRRMRGTPYVPSPLLYGETLYFLTHYQAILTGVDAATGEDAPGAMRLDGLRNIYASPVGASDRIYVTDLDGMTAVISHGEKPKLLALNRLNDSFAASAAIVGGELFLRGEKFLYCIAED